jgi:diguanylate cyclase (GGDEF)-like protein/PAS domain S-box-containing protein
MGAVSKNRPEFWYGQKSDYLSPSSLNTEAHLRRGSNKTNRSMDRKQREHTTSLPEISKVGILEQRLRIANTISAISTRLAQTGDLNAPLDDSLEILGTLVGADRAYVFQFREIGTLMDNTHEWCAEGVTPHIAELQGLESVTFKWFMEKVKQGDAFQISDVSALPAEAESERTILEAQGIRSLLIMPMGTVGHQTGFVGFDNVREAAEWQAEDIDLLRVISQLMGGALERQRAYQALEQSLQYQKAVLEAEKRYRRLMESLPAIVYCYSRSKGANYWSPQVENILGFSQQYLVDKPFLWHDAIHPDDMPMVDEAISAFQVGKRIDLNYRIQDADGNWHWFHDRSIGRLNVEGEIFIEGLAFDITAEKSAEQALRESEQRYRGVVEDTPVLICRYLPEGEIEFVNEAYCRYFGKTAEELVGSNFLTLIPEEDREIVMRNINALTVDSPTQSHDHRVVSSEGAIRWQRWTNRAMFDGEGKPVAYQSIGDDITERKKAKELIEYQATYDILTDLPNRRLLLDRLAQALALCRRHGHKGALLFFDLDQFKHINDSLGHPAGDAILQEVSRRLKNTLREEDTSARLGGDEFVVLLPETSDNPEKAAQQAQTMAERIQTGLSAVYNIHNQDMHLTVSIGITLFPMEDESADDILRQADTAMYRAKEEGKNTIRFFLPSMQLAAEERLSMQNDMRQALSRDELHLHFQPQVDAFGNIIGAEALLRWQHPQRGNIPPVHIIHVAEETGLILAIGEWVLASALGRFKAWTDNIADSPMQKLAINVSPRQFHETDFVIQVERVLDETGADPGRLTLEFTEGIFIDHLEETIEKMEALKRLGVRFSIDDFGTGYSSLAYLKRLPLDEIKIDRSFVCDITTDPSNANLVETIINMAKHLGLDVVAEGVETEEQLDFLRAKGCRLFQGYHFSHPRPGEDFEELLRKPAPYSMGPSSAE